MVVGLQHVIVYPGSKIWLSGVVVLQVIVHVVGIGTSIEFVVMRLNIVMATMVFVVIVFKTWVMLIMSLIRIVMMAWVLLVGYSMTILKTLTGIAIVAMLWVMIVILAVIVAMRVHGTVRL